MHYYKIIFTFMDNTKICHVFVKAKTDMGAKQFFLDILDDNSHAYNIHDVVEDNNITENDVCLNFDWKKILIPA